MFWDDRVDEFPDISEHIYRKTPTLQNVEDYKLNLKTFIYELQHEKVEKVHLDGLNITQSTEIVNNILSTI